MIRKIIFILASASAALALASSCRKLEIEPSAKEVEPAESYRFNMDLNVGGFSSPTKSDATIGWTEGESVFVFFKPEGGDMLDQYLALTYDGSKFNPSHRIPYGSLGMGGKLSAVYVPYLRDGVTPLYGNGCWTIDGGDVYYSCASNVGYTVNDGEVTSTIAMSIPDGYIQISVSVTQAAEGDLMSCNMVDAFNCVRLGSDLKFTEVAVEGKKMTGHAEGGKVYFWGKKNEVEADKCVFTVSSSVTGEDIEKSVPSTAIGANKAYNTSFVPKGALPGGFSVSSTKRVYFSQGNIQYQASTGSWRFAEHQYDYIGNASGNTTLMNDRMNQEDWIDLFGYGATGRTDINESLPQPWEVSADHHKYNPDGDPYAGDDDLTRENGADWGVCMGEGWRTLSNVEWMYLFGGDFPKSREVNGGKGEGYSYSLDVTYCGALGIVIYPDDYSGSVVSGSVSALPEGVVFLPAAGVRDHYCHVYDAGTLGAYWTSSDYGPDTACHFSFEDGELEFTIPYQYYVNRSRGFSVRLVIDCE